MFGYKARLEKFFDLGLYFLGNVSSIDECLLEAKDAQKHLFELIKLLADAKKDLNGATSNFDCFIAEKTVVVHKIFLTRGIKSTQSFIESNIIKMFNEEYLHFRDKKDTMQLVVDSCESMKYALMQRKDILLAVIQHWSVKKEFDSCILQNQAFRNKLLGM